MEEQFDCTRNSTYNNSYVTDGNNTETTKKALNNSIYKKNMHRLSGPSSVFCLFDVYNTFFLNFYFIMSIHITPVTNT